MWPLARSAYQLRADLKTEVEPQSGAGRQELTAIRIRKGVLLATRHLTRKGPLTSATAMQEEKMVLIEHPFRSDWELLEPKEAAERTREVYRFEVEVRPTAAPNWSCASRSRLSKALSSATPGLM